MVMFRRKPQRLFFVHIGKTGGVSFEHILKQNFPQAAICPHYYDTDFVKQPGDPLDYRLFWGHNWYYTLAVMPAGTRPTTFIRDPVERVLSGYEHIRRHDTHDSHNALRHRLTVPADALDDELFRARWSNAQTRVLGRDYDFADLLARCRAGAIDEDGANRELQRMRSAPATRATLERAKDRLAAMAAFGITEEFERSCRWIGRAFRLRIQDIPHLNTAGRKKPRHEVYTEADFAAMRTLNDLDIELYDFARRLLDSKAP